MINRLLRNRKHVFIDWSLVEAGGGNSWLGSTDPWLMPHGVTLKTFAPTIHPEPILLPEKPWEEFVISSWATVFEDEGKFKLYYEGYHSPDSEKSKDVQKHVSQICYAESEDGINWIRPKLGLIPYRDDTETNIVFDGIQPAGIGPHGPTDIEKDTWRPAPTTKQLPRDQWLMWKASLSYTSKKRWMEPLCRFLVTSVITAEHSTDLHEPSIDLAKRIMESIDEIRIKWQHDPDGKQIFPRNADLKSVLSSEMPASYLATFWRGRKQGYW